MDSSRSEERLGKTRITEDRSDAADVEAVAAEYFAAKEVDGTVDLEVYLERLNGDSARSLFRRLVGAVDAQLEARPGVREGMVLGGRYTLEEKIGSGGMGDVWAARDQNVDRRVAVKILNAAASGNLESIEVVRREVRLMESVRHPGIAAVHDFQADEELTYFVMELVDGVSLADVIQDARQHAIKPDGRRLAEIIGHDVPDGQDEVIGNEDWYRSVARVMIEVLRVIEAAHAKGIVHRDLKPNNIMLTGGGRPKVLDFGLGRSVDTKPSELTEGLTGTLFYVAPEQVDSKRTGVNPRADIYQLGAVLYEFLTMSRVVDGDSITEVLSQITQGQISRPRKIDPHIPRELEDICLHALEHAPERRYATVQSFRRDLERYLAGLELPRACSGALGRRVRYFARRHRTLLTVAGAVVLTAALVYGLMPRNKLFDSVELVDANYDVDGSMMRPIVRTKVDVVAPCYFYGMLHVTREDGTKYCCVLVDDLDRLSQEALQVGPCQLKWRTADFVLRKGDHYESEIFASRSPGGFDQDWDMLSNLASYHDGLIPLDTANKRLEAIRQASRSAEQIERPTVEMLLGTEDLGKFGQSQRLSGVTVP